MFTAQKHARTIARPHVKYYRVQWKRVLHQFLFTQNVLLMSVTAIIALAIDHDRNIFL